MSNIIRFALYLRRNHYPTVFTPQSNLNHPESSCTQADQLLDTTGFSRIQLPKEKLKDKWVLFHKAKYLFCKRLPRGGILVEVSPLI